MRAPQINTLDESAAALHEMYLSYMRAGFTRDQAMQLVLQVVASIGTNSVHDSGGEDDASA